MTTQLSASHGTGILGRDLPRRHWLTHARERVLGETRIGMSQWIVVGGQLSSGDCVEGVGYSVSLSGRGMQRAVDAGHVSG